MTENEDPNSPLDVEESADNVATLQNQLTQLKALAYDHYSTIQRLQGELRSINDAIDDVNERLNPTNQEVQQ